MSLQRTGRCRTFFRMKNPRSSKCSKILGSKFINLVLDEIINVLNADGKRSYILLSARCEMEKPKVLYHSTHDLTGDTGLKHGIVA